VLLVTLVLLVVLSTLGYTLSSRLAAQRHRDQYIIDYCNARYGCDSAVKYALATLEDITPELISRPNVPDFSDLFILSEEEYQELLAELADKVQPPAVDRGRSFSDINDINDVSGVTDFSDSNSPTIPGPYGPPWPFVPELTEFPIGSATVRIEIEDENAKYPLGWALLDDEEVQREVMAGFETFCEWMDVNEADIDSLKEQLEEIGKIKPFKLEFEKIKKKKLIRKGTKSTRSGRMRGRKAPRFRDITISASKQIADQAATFAKLFHCSLIDTETLARPTIVSESREESALKYMGMWASRKVNINTAPRHVLEAAFTFGGDADRIAEGIIQRRRTQPFTSIADLQGALFGYSDSIKKCEKYITTASNFFTIRVTAVSGVAKTSAVIAIMKEGNRMKKIALISD